MKPTRSTWIRTLIAVGALLVLGVLNFAIVGKQRIARDGQTVYLKLAPIDPRSLLQGDYMALRFELAQAVTSRDSVDATGPREGEVRCAAITLDAQRVASLASADAPPTTACVRYRIRHGQVWLGTNAFFFEEGSAARFNGARYGEFRVDRTSGEAVLVGLRGAALEAL